MKIAIYHNTASQGYLLSEKLKSKNFDVTLFLPQINEINISGDHFVPLYNQLSIKYYKDIKLLINYFFKKFDLVISNNYWKRTWINSKKWLYWHHGTQLLNDPQLTSRLKGSHYVSSPDLIQKEAKLLNRIVDMRNLSIGNQFINDTERTHDFIIGHFPTHKNQKGSKYIDNAIHNMIDIGYDINYLTNYDNHIPKHKFSNIISKCDFIIDQYVPSRGIIALTGLEAMLLGVNVISSLNKTGVEDSKLLNLVNNFYKEDGLLYFNLNKKSPQILKNYVIQHHSGDKTLDILRNDNII